jgi:acylphosphatase
MPSKASTHLEVRGRVQGVGFRWYVMELARELELAGWVKNRPDGIVEIAAAGEPDALAKLEVAVAAGPPGAHVEEMRKLGEVPGDSLQIPFGIVR